MGSTVWGMRRGVARTTRLLQQTPGEKKVASVLQSALTPSKLSVKDISGKHNATLIVLCLSCVFWRDYFLCLLGGCGSMFEIVIEAEGFRGKRTVQQHQMVNDVSGTAMKRVQLCEGVVQVLLHCLPLLNASYSRTAWKWHV